MGGTSGHAAGYADRQRANGRLPGGLFKEYEEGTQKTAYRKGVEKMADEFLKADRDWDAVLDELRYQSRFEMESGLGYKDLKDEKSREFIRGMAWMYNELETAADNILDETGEDTPVLARIRTECGEALVKELKQWFVCAMEEMLTSMLDDECEDEDGER